MSEAPSSDTEAERTAFWVQLLPGSAAGYKARHDEPWSERVVLLGVASISDYSIFLHEPSGSLFAVLRRTARHDMDQLPKHDVMRRWWRHTGDVMVTEAVGAPALEMLPLMFHLT